MRFEPEGSNQEDLLVIGCFHLCQKQTGIFIESRKYSRADTMKDQ